MMIMYRPYHQSPFFTFAPKLFFLATVATTLLSKPVCSYVWKSIQDKLEQEQNNKIIILGPTNSTSSTNDNNKSKRNVLLIIIPNKDKQPSDYISLAKDIIQNHADNSSNNENDNINLIIGISYPLSVKNDISSSTWNFNAQSDNKAVIDLIKSKALATIRNNRKLDNVFIMGHGQGAANAVCECGYPSTISGIILYGASWHRHNNKGSTSIVSYPRPTMTIMNDQDVTVPFFDVAPDVQTIMNHDNIIAPKNNLQNNEKTKKLLQQFVYLTKPIVIISPNNNDITTDSNAADAATNTTIFSLPKSQQDMVSSLIVDFMSIHGQKTLPLLEELSSNDINDIIDSSSSSSSSPSLRLLQQVQKSQEKIQPYLQLVDSDYIATFQQEQLLKQFDLQTEMSTSTTSLTTTSIVPQWRTSPTDFLFSKANFWNQQILFVPITKQKPIVITTSLSSNKNIRNDNLIREKDNNNNNNNNNSAGTTMLSLCQLSKTVAVKAFSKEFIYSKLKKSVSRKKTPTLQSINEETFNHVLQNIVTQKQRENYLKNGTKLIFGPDQLIRMPPTWVETPITITPNKNNNKSDNNGNDNNNNCYVLQSPYTKTSNKLPYPFGGVYYSKPMTPSQAYEWIVFDAFRV